MATRCVENINIMMMAELPFFGGRRIRKGDEQIAQLFGLGSFAEYCVVHERSAVKVRNDAPSDVVCLMGCGFTTGLGAAVNTANIHAGDSVVIYGVGGVGLAVVATVCGGVIADVIQHRQGGGLWDELRLNDHVVAGVDGAVAHGLAEDDDHGEVVHGVRRDDPRERGGVLDNGLAGDNVLAGLLGISNQ